MAKNRKGFLLINTRLGSPSSCYLCSSEHVTVAVHTDIDYVDLRGHRGDLDKTQQSRLRKAYPKQCNEIFLCEKCFGSNYSNNPLLRDGTGHHLYTTVPIKDWEQMAYLTVDEAVDKFG